MASTLVVYLLVSYMVLAQDLMKFMRTPEFLNEIFVLGFSYKFIVYLSAIFIFIGVFWVL